MVGGRRQISAKKGSSPVCADAPAGERLVAGARAPSGGVFVEPGLPGCPPQRSKLRSTAGGRPRFSPLHGQAPRAGRPTSASARAHLPAACVRRAELVLASPFRGLGCFSSISDSNPEAAEQAPLYGWRKTTLLPPAWRTRGGQTGLRQRERLPAGAFVEPSSLGCAPERSELRSTEGGRRAGGANVLRRVKRAAKKPRPAPVRPAACPQNDTSAACFDHSTDWCPVSRFQASRIASMSALRAGVSSCSTTSTFDFRRSGCALPRNSHWP